jgi:hypothetical protein
MLDNFSVYVCQLYMCLWQGKHNLLDLKKIIHFHIHMYIISSKYLISFQIFFNMFENLHHCTRELTNLNTNYFQLQYQVFLSNKHFIRLPVNADRPGLGF